MRRLVLLMLLVVLTGCGEASSGKSVDQATLATSMQGGLTRAIRERDAPLTVRQAEFQDADGELWWITQFDDPAETGALSGVDTETLVFGFPLEVLRAAVRENDDKLRSLSNLSTFIIAFRDPQSTVYEIDADLMWRYVEGEADWREVTSEMLISGR